jgi:hypothetical protein
MVCTRLATGLGASPLERSLISEEPRDGAASYPARLICYGLELLAQPGKGLFDIGPSAVDVARAELDLSQHQHGLLRASRDTYPEIEVCAAQHKRER